MGVILALIPQPARLQRLRAATRDTHSIVACDNWNDVYAACDGQIVHFAVLDFDSIGAPSFDPVRQLKLMAPRTTVIAYVTMSLDRVHHIFDAGRYGFDGLIITDLDDGPSAFAKTLERASARGLGTLVRRIVSGSGSPVARDAMMLAVTRAHEHLTPASLARILAVPPRQLSRELADAHYPSASRLIMWGRLLVSAELLDDPRYSAERIALVMHFPSGSAFRNTVQRYFGCTPRDLRERGGALYALDVLRRTVSHPTVRSKPNLVDATLK